MGIPAVSFARFSWSGGVEFHSRKDVIERLSETKFNNTSSFIIKFIEEILKDDKILNETCLCEDIKKQIEEYAKF